MHANRPAADPLQTLRRLAAGLLVVLATLAPELHAATVTKPVYMNAGTALSRTPSTSTTATTLAKAGGTATWTMTPTTAAALTIPAGATLDIYLDATCNGNKNLVVDFTLDTTGGTVTTLGTLANTAVTTANCGTYSTLGPFTVTIGASPVTLNAGTALRLIVTNQTTGGGPNPRDFLIRPSDGTTSLSRIEYDVDTFINVDSVTAYNAAYPSGTVITSVGQGSTAYIRAQVSDPFGAYDIFPTNGRAPSITLSGPSALTTDQAMTIINALTTAGTKTFEYTQAIGGATTTGAYTVAVTGYEGTEGCPACTVTHLNNASTLTVVPTNVALTRLSVVFSDPVNSMTNPKRVPGSEVTHTITPGSVGGGFTANQLFIYEELNSNNDFVVGSIAFNAGTSGLTGIGTVQYSSNACASFVNNVTPTGIYDSNVRCIRFNPTGTFANDSTFTITYRSHVK